LKALLWQRKVYKRPLGFVINMKDTIDGSVESGMISIRRDNSPNINVARVHGSEQRFGIDATPSGGQLTNVILDHVFANFEGGKEAMVQLIINKYAQLGYLAEYAVLEN